MIKKGHILEQLLASLYSNLWLVVPYYFLHDNTYIAVRMSAVVSIGFVMVLMPAVYTPNLSILSSRNTFVSGLYGDAVFVLVLYYLLSLLALFFIRPPWLSAGSLIVLSFSSFGISIYDINRRLSALSGDYHFPFAYHVSWIIRILSVPLLTLGNTYFALINLLLAITGIFILFPIRPAITIQNHCLAVSLPNVTSNLLCLVRAAGLRFRKIFMPNSAWLTEALLSFTASQVFSFIASINSPLSTFKQFTIIIGAFNSLNILFELFPLRFAPQLKLCYASSLNSYAVRLRQLLFSSLLIVLGCYVLAIFLLSDHSTMYIILSSHISSNLVSLLPGAFLLYAISLACLRLFFLHYSITSQGLIPASVSLVTLASVSLVLPFTHFSSTLSLIHSSTLLNIIAIAAYSFSALPILLKRLPTRE